MKKPFAACFIGLLASLSVGRCVAAERIFSQSSDGVIYSPSRNFSVNYAPARVTDHKVELWYAVGEGGEWEYYGVDKDGEAPMDFRAAGDGLYLLYFRAAKDAGEQGKEFRPEAQLRVAVDTTPPSVEIASPKESDVFERGEAIPLTWQVSDANPMGNGVDVLFVPSEEENWRFAATALGPQGSLNWEPPPDVTGKVRLRVRAVDRAGNGGEATVEMAVGSKQKAMPVAPLQIPSSSRSKEVRINFRLSKEMPSGDAEVELWTTEDGGQSWFRYGIVKASEGYITFHAPRDGKYGFKLVGASPAGLTEPQPEAGTKPDLECLVDTKPPRVFLLSPIGGETWQAGQVQKIAWQAEDENLAEEPVSIYYSSDGAQTWKPIAAGIGNSKEYPWQAPWVESDRFLVKIEVKDEAGNVSEAVSRGAFSVDVSPPSVEPVGVQGGVEPAPTPEPVKLAPATESTVAPPVKPVEEPQKAEPVLSADAMVEDATKLLMVGDLRGAEGALREAFVYYPYDVRVINDLGAILVRLERYDEAIEILSYSVGRQDPDVRYNLGVAYRRAGDAAAAVEEFRAALALAPDFAEARWGLASALSALGRTSEAAPIWEEMAHDTRLTETWRRKAAELAEPRTR